MADVNRYMIFSIPEFVECIKGIRAKEKSDLWFRGHSKARYKLLPGLFRDPFIFQDHKGTPFTPRSGEIISLNRGGYKGFSTKRLLQAFKDNYSRKKNVLYHPEDDFEWVCLMQHYGVPTSLLDWSTNAFTALYFALLEPHHKPFVNNIKRPTSIPSVCSEMEFEGAVVYVINPKKVNAVNIASRNPFKAVFDFSKRKDLIAGALFPTDFEESFFYFPICVTAKKFDFRILAQQGVFMLFGKSIWDLEYIDHMKPIVHKIFIPQAAVLEMAADLKNLGFGTKAIFPDLDRNATIAKTRLHKGIKEILESEEAYVKSALTKH